MPERKRDHRGRFTGERTPAEEKKKKFLELAMQRFKQAEDAEARWRRDALEAFNFYIGEQWPVDIKAQRDRDRRPCLTINRLKTFKRLICNEMRQQRPAIQINPVGDGASTETAQIEQGMIRHIEVNSDAEVSYDIADENMVIGGLGWLELSTRFRPGKTMQQEIHIGAATNPFMHYGDPTTIESDKSDSQFHFKIRDYTRAEFEKEFPNTEAASLDDFSSVGDNAKDWLMKDAVRVAEYWYMEYQDSVLYQLADGSIVEEEPEGGDEDNPTVSKRNWQKPVCMWCKITAVDIIDGNEDNTAGRETVWDSIPNVPVIGEERDINGKRYIVGMVHDAIDPQRQFNYWETACTEKIALANKAQWKAYAEVLEGFENEWASSNRENKAVLRAKAVMKGEELLPLPERIDAEAAIEAMAQMRQSGAANIEAVTGINDAMIGRVRPDESGKAVLARQKQGDVSNLNYSDNSARAKRRVGRLILPAIPKVYDVPTIMRIVNPDGTTQHVVTHVGAGQKDDATALLKQNPAIAKMFDLSVGTYDVTVSVGPSYQTKRQEAVASIMALLQAAPQVLSLVGDLLVGNMDWNQAPEISKRLKLWVMQQNPWLQTEEGDTPQIQAQKAQAQLAALQQVHGQVVDALQQAQNIISAKQVEQQGKMGIEKMRIDADVLLAKMKTLGPILVAEINTKAQDKTVRDQIDADVASELRGMAHELAMASVVPAAQVSAQAAAQPQNGSQPQQ
jgi:Phage P22-like portal protein